MRIERVVIEKFRSIREADVHLGDITAFVGENNAGKTTVLRAINSVLNFEAEKNNFLRRIHQYAPKSNTHITLTLGDVPEAEPYSSFSFDGCMTIKLSYTYSTGRAKLAVEQNRAFVAAPDELLQALSRDICYVFIPAERSGQDILFGSDTVFGRLVEKYVAEQVKNRDSISGGVRQASNRIHSSVLIKLENQMNNLYLQDKTVGFRIGFPDDIDYQVFFDSIQVSFSEGNASYPMQEWGSGTKSLAIIAAHRAIALMSGASVILGIEEPETNLHPQAQRHFLQSLRSGMAKEEMQALITTHSTVLVDELEHEDVVLVRRVPDKKRGFRSKLSQLPADFWLKCGLEDFKHYQFFRYRNSDFFFSRFVVVGESKNDCQVFQKLIETELGDDVLDVSFLNAEGIANIRYPYFLFKALEIPCAFIVDRDFFFNYSAESLEKSRDKATGLPMYQSHVKAKDSVIDDLIPTDSSKAKYEEARRQGYRRAFSVLADKGFYVMNYSLDIDLTCSAKARQEYYRLLSLEESRQSQKVLLTECSKAIKRIDIMMNVLSAIPKTSYPESYKKIKNALVASIRTML